MGRLITKFLVSTGILLSGTCVCAQDWVEIGVSQTFVRSRSDATLLQRHGAFVHVGYNFNRYAIHLKAYSGHVYYPYDSEFGYGFGIARTNSLKIDSNLRFDIGLAGLYVLKRNNQRPNISQDFYSILLETKLRYNLTKHFYLTSQLSLGYGMHRAKSFRVPEFQSFDAPYPVSIGVGISLHGP